MILNYKKAPRILLFGILTFAIIFGTIPPVQSQSGRTSLSEKIPSRWQFSPPSRIGVPVGREGGATRAVEMPVSSPLFESEDGGDVQFLRIPNSRGGNTDSFDPFPVPPSSDFCAGEPVVILVPETAKTLTASANPTFYWYLPPNNGAAVEFSLADAQNRKIYTTQYIITENTLDPNNSDRIMGLQMPNTPSFPGLKTGQEYIWEVKLICNLNEPNLQVGARGVIERIPIDPQLHSSLGIASAENKLGLYANANLWHETINTLINLRRQKPDDPEVKAAWQKLMESANLTTLIETESQNDETDLINW